ncbi:MAG TPA: acylneuraminate cytidylyltransferase family protein [Bacteroidia bacterium]|nr:acylneuraminate cytidylyltransferase family protein [Bacteroidia bacterium]
MYKDQRIVALIPARGGSKRLPRKNVLPLRGIPLIQWSIAAARGSTLIDEVIVSTDDPEIAQIAALAGAVVMDRPSNLALDHTPSLPVFQDALQRMRPEADLLVVMQPTTPFRRVSDIDDSIRRLIDQDADALIAVTKAKMGPEWLLQIQDGYLQMPESNSLTRTRSQDQLPYYQINGSLYLFKPATVLNADRYAWGPRTLPLILEKPWDIDIDDLIDFRIANAIAHEFDLHC